MSAKKPTRAERFARAAEDELPYAAQSGLTTSLIAGAQPKNAMMDRRIHQPSLASMAAMNPEPPMGLMGAMREVYADPRRMLPGSGGWTEGVGAAAPHLAAAAVDLINPAAMASRAGGVARNAMAESANSMSQMKLPPVQFRQPVVLPQGPINPHFAPTGKKLGLLTRGNTSPEVSDWTANSLLTEFNKAIQAGDKNKMNWVARRIDATVENGWLYKPEEMREIYKVHEYMSDVMNNRVNATRHAPYGATRSSNSNAPTLSTGAQPDPYAPTIGREGPLVDPEKFMRQYE